MASKVLIVDDEPNIVISLEFLMKQQGYETRVARDGDEALAEVESFRPDLVLLDVMLPRRDGFEVCQKLRADGWTDLKIVMLTAKGRDVEIEKGLALGADAYVTKPFSTGRAGRAGGGHARGAGEPRLKFAAVVVGCSSTCSPAWPSGRGHSDLGRRAAVLERVLRREASLRSSWRAVPARPGVPGLVFFSATCSRRGGSRARPS